MVNLAPAFIILILVVAIIIVAIIIYERTRPVASQPPTISGQFLSPCTTSPCNTNLICDSAAQYTCKLPAGAVCQTATDCATGLFCSGVCVANGTATGGQDQPCPCDDGFICLVSAGNPSICKGAVNQVCSTDADCLSNNCNNGVCADLINGAACSSNPQCLSNNCSNGFCQPLGTVTGSVGASCFNLDCNPTSNSLTATCNSDLTCICSVNSFDPPTGGICVSEVQGLGIPCTSTTACAAQLECYVDGPGDFGLCQDSDNAGCACTFFYPNPNVNNNCIDGMSPVNGLCLNGHGLGCGSNSNCLSGVCNLGATGTLGVYTFEGQITANFSGATDIGLETLSQQAPNRASKIFATTSGSVDIIYVVDQVQGLVSTTVAVNNPNPIFIPLLSNSSTLTIVDVAYNPTSYLGTNMLVAVKQSGFVVVYIWVPGTAFTTAVPFNPQTGSGPPGTQYYGGAPLNIQFLDISSPNDGSSTGGDIVVTVPNGDGSNSVYVSQYINGYNPSYQAAQLAGPDGVGLPVPATVGPASFYYDLGQVGGTCWTGINNPVLCPSWQNVAYIPDTMTTLITQPLSFTGDNAPVIIIEDGYNENVIYQTFAYSIYSPFCLCTGINTCANCYTVPPTQPFGMTSASIMTLAGAYIGGALTTNVVTITGSGQTLILPGQVSSNSLCLATVNGFYVLWLGICI